MDQPTKTNNMKAITINELRRLATYYGGEVTSDLMPAIDFGGYGIEPTEMDETGRMSGFRYYGPPDRQTAVLDLWEELTTPSIAKPLLTVEAARQLIGKRVRLSYCDVNNGEELVTIVGMDIEQAQSIGQAENYRLAVRNVSKPAAHYILPDGRKVYSVVDVTKPGSVYDPVEDYSSIAHLRYDVISGQLQAFDAAAWAKCPAWQAKGRPFDQLPFVSNSLQFVPAGNDLVESETISHWPYEWQGIFRRGSGAERLFIEQVY
jgi:hypothetical protein